MRTMWARLLAVSALAVGLAATPLQAQKPASSASMAAPSVQAVPGKFTLMLGDYDLAKLDYQADEYFVSGTATSYRLVGAATEEGRWGAQPAGSAPYTTRVIVVRPSDPAKFSGTVIVEWFNVTAGSDTPADGMVAHREMIRRGHAYVGVSSQAVGIEGGQSVMGAGSPIKKVDPARYGSLSHPGDAYSYDIFSQAGRAVKASRGNGLLGPLRAARVIAAGESQSAAYLTTYVNAIDPMARVYDGVFVHSRFGNGAAVDGSRGGGAGLPPYVKFRPDLRVPVLSLITETDLVGGRLGGYYPARRADNRNLRVWEVTGTAHADNYLFGGSQRDDGTLPVADLAKMFAPTTQTSVGPVKVPINTGIIHHNTVQAALAALDRWVRTGRPPASTAPLRVTPGATPQLVLDANGLARGGVRTPWVDVPTMRLSGIPLDDSFIGRLVGSAQPLDAATLARLYPGGKADYLARFTRALDAAIRAGHVLAADRAEILAIAAINYPG